MVASLDLVMRTTVCSRKTEITMRVGAILIGHPCDSILETGKKKEERRRPQRPPAWFMETFTPFVTAESVTRHRKVAPTCQQSLSSHPRLQARGINSYRRWDVGCSNYKSISKGLPLSQHGQGRLVSTAGSAWAGMPLATRCTAPNPPVQPHCYPVINEDNLQHNFRARLELIPVNTELPYSLCHQTLPPSSVFSCLPVHPSYRKPSFATDGEH